MGLGYTLLLIKDFKQVDVELPLFGFDGTPFFLVAGTIGYDFKPIKKHPSFYVLPQFRIGTYSGYEYYEGPGKRLYIGTNLNIGYRIKEIAGLQFGINYNYWHYKNKDYSSRFDRNTNEQIKWNALYFTIGTSFSLVLKRNTNEE